MSRSGYITMHLRIHVIDASHPSPNLIETLPAKFVTVFETRTTILDHGNVQLQQVDTETATDAVPPHQRLRIDL